MAKEIGLREKRHGLVIAAPGLPLARQRTWRTHVVVLLLYAAVAVAFSWPLTANLQTHLTGHPGRDTGVYVWNQWVFRHELIENRSLLPRNSILAIA